MAGPHSRTTDERKRMAMKGQAMSDGSFPIATRSELKSAIQLARTPAQRQHVMKMARRMGLTSMIPETWQSDGSLKARAGTRFLLTGDYSH